MKASRVVRLAAAQLCCAGLLSETALAANALGAWSNLWRTPDEQGQALLDAGQPAQAAERFHDPRRRAYADLEASGYEAAAKLLAPFTDAQSEYNRGNALAKSGQLQAALAAYDAALKQAPVDEDIRHNRDLVERALQQQHHQSPQSSSRNGQQGGQAGAAQHPGAGGSQSAGGDQMASSGSRAGADPPGNVGRASSPNEAPGQAQRNAALAAALARAQRRRGAAGTGSLLAGGARTPKPKPESERQMALDQWLRQIPDSPAGLLRRKFLIEHVMRHQDSGDSEGSVQ